VPDSASRRPITPSWRSPSTRRSAPLSADASTTASIGARQNVATIALETQDGTAVALGAVNSATISLNTSE
jgi:hypothetical protein